MTGYQSKRTAAQDKMDDDDAQKYIAEYEATLDIAYEAGYYEGKKAALAGREQNFCPRCGKRTQDIHTCTPPQETIIEKI